MLFPKILCGAERVTTIGTLTIAQEKVLMGDQHESE